MTLRTSEPKEQLAPLFEALGKAQADMKPAEFDRTNPHFNARYATLASVWASIREPLTKNGLAVIQSLTGPELKILTTRLAHKTGAWIETDVPVLIDRSGMQPLGSALTYAKRYGLSALTGAIADDDDDGNASQATKPGPKAQTPRKPNDAPEKSSQAPQNANGKAKPRGPLVALGSIIKASGWQKAEATEAARHLFGIERSEDLSDDQARELSNLIASTSFRDWLEKVMAPPADAALARREGE